MIDAPTVFGVLLVTGSLLPCWYHVAHKIARIRREIAQLDRQIAIASRSIRTLGGESLRVRRLTMAQVEHERQLSQDAAEIETAIAAFHRTASPLVVLDERKTVGDRLWQVPVGRTADGAQRPWRTFLVWAPDPDRAQMKVAMRYPPKAGHGIGAADERFELPDTAQ